MFLLYNKAYLKTKKYPQNFNNPSLYIHNCLGEKDLFYRLLALRLY